uniref:Uncharacterized protein n=1 Tax=Arundo donax TaxID=35708 RepID=A0A0A9D6V1_ARUDO
MWFPSLRSRKIPPSIIKRHSQGVQASRLDIVETNLIRPMEGKFEWHINKNRHHSRKPMENQAMKTLKKVPAAGSLPYAMSHGSLKKAKVI